MRRLLPTICLVPLLAVQPARADAPGPGYIFNGGATRSVADLAATGDALLVDVWIGDKGPYRFAVDTGAGNTLDTGLAAELGLVASDQLPVRGAGETLVTAGLAELPAIIIGDVLLRDQAFRILPLAASAGDYALPYRGLIGHELFDKLVVTLDPEKRHLVLNDPNAFHYDGDGQKVSLGFHDHIPTIDGAVDGIAARFMLDTGQANSVTLFRPFLVRRQIENRWLRRLTTQVGWGIGGNVMAEVARGDLLALGSVAVDRPVLYLSTQRSGVFSDDDIDGNVGQGVFSRFTVTFDYPQHCAWFERNAVYGQGDGLHIMTVKRSFLGYEVLSVLAGSSAAIAGLRPGDVIEGIRYKDAARYEPPDLQRLFRHPAGTEVPMLVRSNGRLKEMIIVLKPQV